MNDSVIYLDYQATAPPDGRVVEAMAPYWRDGFGNPHAVNHRIGWAAKEAVAAARRDVAALAGADPDEIVFTSGATEANNLALLGAVSDGGHVIAAASEHPSVLSCLDALEDGGAAATFLPVGPDGLLDPDDLRRALRPETRLVSVMAANNEIGVLQPLAEIGTLCRAAGALFHCDAAQAFGKVPIDLAAVDLLSVSAHKMHGPMGIGALYVRRSVRLRPLIRGGGQERGLRAGTLPTPLCIGFGEACRIAAAERTAEAERVARLRDRLLDGLRALAPGLRVNGSLARRLPGNLTVAWPGVDAEALLLDLPGLALSTGSACATGQSGPSHVLRAIGLPDELAHGSLRFGLGRFTGEAEIDRALAMIGAALSRLGPAQAV